MKFSQRKFCVLNITQGLPHICLQGCSQDQGQGSGWQSSGWQGRGLGNTVPWPGRFAPLVDRAALIPSDPVGCSPWILAAIAPLNLV
jgi:hypothetical protein